VRNHIQAIYEKLRASAMVVAVPRGGASAPGGQHFHELRHQP
jgi:hypothetical protein